ncbi:hypothetical protein ONZ45_g1093 [Pleurotus djamor]|nr:hypothetical protein ONZ45_g1093 [Pleurotus djamor]
MSSFLGPLYAAFVDYECSQIEIYDWTQSSLLQPCKSVLQIDEKYRSINLKLLPRHQIMVYGEHSLYVFGIPDMSDDNSDAPGAPSSSNAPLYRWTFADDIVFPGGVTASTVDATGLTMVTSASSKSMKGAGATLQPPSLWVCIAP